MTTDTATASLSPVDTFPIKKEGKKEGKKDRKPDALSPIQLARAMAQDSLAVAKNATDDDATLRAIASGTLKPTQRELKSLAQAIADSLHAESMAKEWRKLARARAEIVSSVATRFDPSHTLRGPDNNSCNASALILALPTATRAASASARVVVNANSL